MSAAPRSAVAAGRACHFGCAYAEEYAVAGDHGGGCDPRPQSIRIRRLLALEKRLDGDALTQACETEAASA